MLRCASTLNLGGAGTVTISGPLAMNAGFVQTGGGTLQITSLPSGSGSITLRAGTLQANMNSNWAIGGTTGTGGIYIADASSNSTDNQSVLLGSGVTMRLWPALLPALRSERNQNPGTDSASGVATINTYIQLESGSINLQFTAPPGGQFNLPLGILGSTTAGITIVGGGTISLGGIGARKANIIREPRPFRTERCFSPVTISSEMPATVMSWATAATHRPCKSATPPPRPRRSSLPHRCRRHHQS